MKKTPHEKTENISAIRLNKLIANNCNCSRKEADKLIQKGIISVNGKINSQMGIKVTPKDIIKLNNTKLSYYKKRYVLLNKPKNYSCYNLKEKKPNSITELIAKACEEKIYPIDELKKMETGLCLFTNDKDLIKKMKNSKTIKKIYHLILDKELTKTDIMNLKSQKYKKQSGVFINSISYVKGKAKNEIGVENTTGDVINIKQLFEKLKYSILSLDRVYIGGLTKKDLPRKSYRHLTNTEINILKRI